MCTGIYQIVQKSSPPNVLCVTFFHRINFILYCKTLDNPKNIDSWTILLVLFCFFTFFIMFFFTSDFTVGNTTSICLFCCLSLLCLYYSFKYSLFVLTKALLSRAKNVSVSICSLMFDLKSKNLYEFD